MALEHRGMLIHVTHIDPDWIKCKDTEEPFDLKVALELLPLPPYLPPLADVASREAGSSLPFAVRRFSPTVSSLRPNPNSTLPNGLPGSAGPAG